MERAVCAADDLPIRSGRSARRRTNNCRFAPRANPSRMASSLSNLVLSQDGNHTLPGMGPGGPQFRIMVKIGASQPRRYGRLRHAERPLRVLQFAFHPAVRTPSGLMIKTPPSVTRNLTIRAHRHPAAGSGIEVRMQPIQRPDEPAGVTAFGART